MEKKDHLYHKGYIDGYRDGIRDSAGCNLAEINETDLTNLPIKAMAISTRTHNCLSRAGRTHIADVAALIDRSIATMRNMGVKTASEVANWLDSRRIYHSVWSKYL